MKDRVLLHLCADLNSKSQGKGVLIFGNHELDTSTILVGDGTYNGIHFPLDEVQKVEALWDKKPIVMNHESDDIGRIVGYITEPKMEESKMTIKPVLDPVTADYKKANGYIQTRFNAGDIPNVSVGVWADRVLERDEDGNKKMVARNLEPDHLGLVVHGACNPQDGCGIGMSEDKLEYKTTLFLDEGIEVNYVSKEPNSLYEQIGSNAYDDLELVRKDILKEQIKKEKLI